MGRALRLVGVTEDEKRRRPSRQALLDALVALLPTVSHRRDIGGTPEAREDALMDAILRVLQAEEDTAALTTVEERVGRRYALRIVHNALIDRFRRDARLPTTPLDEAETTEPTDSSSPESGRRALAGELLGELSHEDQAVLHAYLSGADAFREELAHRGISPGAGRVRVHRMLKKLRTRSEGRLGP